MAVATIPVFVRNGLTFLFDHFQISGFLPHPFYVASGAPAGCNIQRIYLRWVWVYENTWNCSALHIYSAYGLAYIWREAESCIILLYCFIAIIGDTGIMLYCTKPWFSNCFNGDPVKGIVREGRLSVYVLGFCFPLKLRTFFLFFSSVRFPWFENTIHCATLPLYAIY